MTDEEMEELAKSLLEDERDKGLVPVYMPVAKARAVALLWPFEKDGKAWEDVPERYFGATAELCAFLIGKRGAEGETRHVENGTTHEWGSGDVPTGILSQFVPYVGVPL